MRTSAAWLLGCSLTIAGLSSCGDGAGARDGMRGRAAAGGSGPGAAVSESASAYPFKLVNSRVYPVLVYASAGAGEVMLDTVGAADSVRIEVLLASEPLKLRAVDLEGNELGTEFIDLPDVEDASSPPDSGIPIRWELPPSP